MQQVERERWDCTMVKLFGRRTTTGMKLLRTWKADFNLSLSQGLKMARIFLTFRIPVWEIRLISIVHAFRFLLPGRRGKMPLTKFKITELGKRSGRKNTRMEYYSLRGLWRIDFKLHSILLKSLKYLRDIIHLNKIFSLANFHTSENLNRSLYLSTLSG